MARSRKAYQQSMQGARVPSFENSIIEGAYIEELNKHLKKKISEFAFHKMIWLSSCQWVIGRLGYYLKNILLPILETKDKTNINLKFTEKKIFDISKKMYTLLIEFERTSNEFGNKSELLTIIN